MWQYIFATWITSHYYYLVFKSKCYLYPSGNPSSCLLWLSKKKIAINAVIRRARQLRKFIFELEDRNQVAVSREKGIVN